MHNLNVVKISGYPGRVTMSATPLGTGKPGYHHGDLEVALVAEATALVRAHGAEAVSLRQVAQAVGVSPSAAYGHFPDKHALMSAVAAQGMADLDDRMVAGVTAIPGEDDRAAVERFWRAGEEYVRFAVEEPHLFRHMFGPYCPAVQLASELAAQGVDLAGMEHKAESVSYQLLCSGLDDLEARGLLRPGVRDGLDVVIWATVHGFACLVLDGLLPLDSRGLLLSSISRLALVDGVMDPRQLSA